MGKKHPPLRLRDVERILENLGFIPRKQKGTSHQQWVKQAEGGPFRKVTLDRGKGDFAQPLIHKMADQAGVSLNAFYEALEKKK